MTAILLVSLTLPIIKVEAAVQVDLLQSSGIDTGVDLIGRLADSGLAVFSLLAVSFHGQTNKIVDCKNSNTRKKSKSRIVCR